MTKTKTAPIAFLVTSRSGLGHLRRAASIAGALIEASPEATLRLYTNAAPAGLTGSDLSAFSAVRVSEREEMAQHAAADGAAVLVADTVVPDKIERLEARSALILRQTPDDRLGRFLLPDQAKWDLVLIPNPAVHWLPDRAKQMSRRVIATGWIYRHPKARAPSRRGRPLVLVATGGGGTAETALPLVHQIDEVLASARRLMPEPFEVIQALGPRAPTGAMLSNADRVIDPRGDLNEYFASADAVISTAGYNSILELAITTTPALLMAISRTFDDQAQRAGDWGPRLGMTHEPDDHVASAMWLASILPKRKRRPAVEIGPSGASLAARAILELLP